MYVGIVVKNNEVVYHKEAPALKLLDAALKLIIQSKEYDKFTLQVFPQNILTPYLFYDGHTNLYMLFAPEITADFSGTIQVLKDQLGAKELAPKD